MMTSDEQGGTVSPPRLRLFFAAWPPATAAAALYRYAAEIATTTGGRVMRAENLHVTLAFLGDIAAERLPVVVGAGRGVPTHAHRLPIDAARYRARSRLLWAEPQDSPPALEALVAALAHTLTAAGFTLERRRFAAHVTLIRNAGKPGKLPPLPEIDWPVAEFTLVRSAPSAEGSRYEIVERFALG